MVNIKSISKNDTDCLTKHNFHSYLKKWNIDYNKKIKTIELFNPSLTNKWTKEQKIYFTRLFYHARGHFHNFLWFLGNFSNDKSMKEIVIKNISEEFNSSSQSHEQMYLNFAQSLGINIIDEVIEETSYLPFLKVFNKGHIKWLHNHDEESRFAAFSAYECLDNIDYTFLLDLAKSLEINNKGLIFFKIHMQANHFIATENIISVLWNKAPEKVISAYTFIAEHQINMWKNLSEEVFSC